ncbi:uncharacterized protein LOC106171921, partial [Lingula anatina]|uniref:Uncharacterized protein LOC106171921 n=1 Tax=Lingula anatina TaxID=7574 RepID=A0A1S3JBX1_LINAN
MAMSGLRPFLKCGFITLCGGAIFLLLCVGIKTAYQPLLNPEKVCEKSVHLTGSTLQGLQWDKVPVEWKEIMNRRRQMLHQMCKDLNETTNTDTPISVSKLDITDRVIVDDLHRVI